MISLFDKQSGHTDDRWFDEHAQTWVEQGLVTSDQVDAIRAFEHAETTQRSRISLGAELAVYLGSLVALVSGGINGQAWDSLNTAARTGTGLAIAALGFVAGALFARFDDARTRRLASFMWVVGTGGIALAAASLADAAGFDDPAWNVVAIGIPVLLVGAALWRNRDRPLQVLTTAVGAALVVGGAGALLAVPPWLGGIVIWSAAVGVGAAAVTDRLRPELFVLAVASVASMVGALMLVDVTELVGALAATVTAAGIVATGLARRRVPILVIGVVAFLQSLQMLLMMLLDGGPAALVVALAGLAVVVVVVTRSTRDRATPTA